MSRSGYSDDYGYNNQWGLWRGAVASAIRGKRGQAFLREMADALDAMPEKRLVAHDLYKEGSVCAIGSVGVTRGVDMTGLDPEDYEGVAAVFGVASPLVQEIVYMNDEGGSYADTPELRWERMRQWVAAKLPAAQPHPGHPMTSQQPPEGLSAEADARLAFETYCAGWSYTWDEVQPERRKRWQAVVDALSPVSSTSPAPDPKGGWLPIVLCPTDGADRALLLPDGREVIGAHHNPGGWRVTEYLEREEPIMITRPAGFYSSSDPQRMPKRQPEQVGTRKVKMRILSALSEGVYPTHFRPNDTVHGEPAIHGQGAGHE